MPSKKKKKKSGRGKAKKAMDSLDAQMEKLKIGGNDSQAYDEAAMLEEAIKLATAEKKKLESEDCTHGYVPGEDHPDVADFAEALVNGFLSVDADSIFVVKLNAAVTTVPKEAWDDTAKLELVLRSFLAIGTHLVLNNEDSVPSARDFAFLAFFIQKRVESLHGGDEPFPMGKLIDLFKCDEHTLVKYLRKNTPCDCLDEKYKEVKSIPKLTLCCYGKCSLPDRMAERRSLLRCCGETRYCSRECQKAAWPEHKKICESESRK